MRLMNMLFMILKKQVDCHDVHWVNLDHLRFRILEGCSYYPCSFVQHFHLAGFWMTLNRFEHA